MTLSHDATADALQRMKANGYDLARSRDVEFTVVFPNEDSAEQFAQHFRAIGYKASRELTETVDSYRGILSSLGGWRFRKRKLPTLKAYSRESRSL